MIVTVEWMERWFETFNSSYFDAQLPLPVMALSRARTRLGQMAFKRESWLGYQGHDLYQGVEGE